MGTTRGQSSTSLLFTDRSLHPPPVKRDSFHYGCRHHTGRCHARRTFTLHSHHTCPRKMVGFSPTHRSISIMPRALIRIQLSTLTKSISISSPGCYMLQLPGRTIRRYGPSYTRSSRAPDQRRNLQPLPNLTHHLRPRSNRRLVGEDPKITEYGYK